MPQNNKGKKNPVRCHHGRGWTWKHQDFGRLCPKFSPNNGPDCLGYGTYKCVCEVTRVFCPSIILQTWLGMVGCLTKIKFWLILEITLYQ